MDLKDMGKKVVETLAPEIEGAVIGGGLVEIGKHVLLPIFHSFVKEAGVQAAPAAAAWIVAQAFPNTEDERRVEKALRDMPRNEREILERRLAALDSKDHSFWKQLVLDDERPEMVKTMNAHARMSDPEWNNKVLNIQKDREAAEGMAKEFFGWLMGGGLEKLRKEASDGFANHVFVQEVKSAADSIMAKALADSW